MCLDPTNDSERVQDRKDQTDVCRDRVVNCLRSINLNNNMIDHIAGKLKFLVQQLEAAKDEVRVVEYELRMTSDKAGEPGGPEESDDKRGEINPNPVRTDPAARGRKRDDGSTGKMTALAEKAKRA